MASSKLPKLPEIGALVGSRFRITELIGSGGFGTVYRALQENVGREVALKFLAPSVAKDPVNIERFRREAFHVSQLRHPNTITLYDYGQTEEGLFYMVLEILEGLSLADEIQKHGAIDLSRGAHIFLQVLKSLSEAHQRGLVHRDLKPENIHLCEMFGEQDYVKVLDFGVAKMTMFEGGDDVEEKLTRAGRIFGTPMYMAPEQACAEPITPATDIYALGLMLFEILTGLPPVTGRYRMDVIHKQIRDEVPKLTKALKGTPFGNIIRHATRKKPEERFADASVMLEAFYGAVRDSRIVPAPKGSTRPEISNFEIGIDPRVVTPKPVPSYEQVPTPVKAASPPPLPPPLPKVETPPTLPEESVMTSSPPVEVLNAQAKQASEPVPRPKLEVHPTIGEPAAAADEPTKITTTPHQLEAQQPAFPSYQELSLIGRDKDIFKLMDLVTQSVRAKSGHIVLLEGESGIGKSRVVQAVRQGLHQRHVGMCLGVFRRGGQPLEALREALASYWWVSHADRMTVETVIRTDLQSLNFPKEHIDFIIDFVRPLHVEELSSPEHASSLFARLEQVLIQLADIRPFGLVLEDIQYADSATLSFLEYFAITLRTQSTPIVMMVTMRSGERSLNPHLEQSLRSINTNIGVGLTRIRLRRLKGRELSVLLDAILPLDARLKERIAWLSQGNPQHAIQIIHYLWAEGNLKSEQNRWSLVMGTPRQIDLPPDLMDLMSLRVHQSIEMNKSTPKLKETVTWLAILGIRVPFDLLAAVIQRMEGVTRHQLEQNVETLRNYGVVHQRMHRDILCVEFDNSLLREALLRDVLRGTENHQMHKTVAEAKIDFYKQHNIELPMLEIAEHWRQAGMDKEYRDALFGAAQRSMRRHDPRGAREQFRELLRILESHQDIGDIWGRTMVSLAELSRRFGELGLAEDNYTAVLQTDALQGALRSDAQRGLAHLVFALGRYPEAVRYYRDALATSQEVDHRAGVAKALIGLSRVHIRQGDPSAGAKVRERLKAMLPELPRGELAGKVLLHLAESAQRQGQMKERYSYLRRALKNFKNSQDRQGYSDALTELGALLSQPGENSPERLQEAGKLLREALEIKRAIGDRQGTADVFKFLGFVEQELGDLEAAEHYYHQSLRMHEALGAIFHIGTAHNSLGLANMFMGQFDRSTKHFDQAIERFEKVGDKLAVSHVMLNKGVLLLNECKVEEAVALLTETRELKESLGSTWGLYELYNHLALAWMWQGQLNEAESLLQKIVQERADYEADEEKTIAHSLLGLLYVAQSKLQMAALELGRARGDASDIGSKRLTAATLANASVYAAVTGDDEAFKGFFTRFQNESLLGHLRIKSWFEFIEALALHIAEAQPAYGKTLKIAAAKYWKAHGLEDRAKALS